MMKIRINNWLCALMAVMAVFLVGSCSSDDFKTDIGIDNQNIRVNKKGVDSRGQAPSFTVNSNVYWHIELEDESAREWLNYSPVAGSNATTVNLTVAHNDDEMSRSAILKIKAGDGIPREVRVLQEGASGKITYVYETVGATAVTEKVEMYLHRGWNREGISLANIFYTGDDMYIDATTVSDYEDASGGNYLYFNSGQSNFMIPEMRTRGDIKYNLSFGYNRGDNGKATAKSDAEEPLKVLVSNDGRRWYNLPYKPDESTIGWQNISTEFTIVPGTEYLYIKWSSSEAGVLVDDILLGEGDGSGIMFDFIGSGDGPGGLEPGILLWEDNFEWVTPVEKSGKMSSAPDIIDKKVGQDGERMDSWHTSTADDVKALNAGNPGWSYPGYPDGSAYCYIYSRVGGLKMGRGNNAAGAGGYLISPPKALAKLYESSTIRVALRVLPYYSATGVDNNALKVYIYQGPGEIEGDGVLKMSSPSNWDGVTDYESLQFTVSGATSETRFVIGPEEETTSSKNNRYFLDNVKIYYDGAAMGDFEGLPTSWTFFNEAQNGGLTQNPDCTYTADDGKPGTITINRAITPATSSMNGSEPEKRILVYGMGMDDDWRFTVPVKNLRAGKVVNFKGYITSSGAGPGSFITEGSVDGVNWTPVGAETPNSEGVFCTVYIFKETNVPKPFDVDYTVPQNVIDGNLYMRIRIVNNISNGGGAVNPGGGATNRLVDGVSMTIKEGTVDPDPKPDPDELQGIPITWTFFNIAQNDNVEKNPNLTYMADSGMEGTITIVRQKDPASEENASLNGLASENRILAYGMGKDDYWLFTVPVKNLKAGTIVNFKGEVASSNAGPGSYITEISMDKENWMAVGATSTTSLGEPCTVYINKSVNEPHEFNVDCPVPVDIKEGDVYMRLRVVNDVANGGGKVNPGGGGTNRLVNSVSVSVKK